MRWEVVIRKSSELKRVLVIEKVASLPQGRFFCKSEVKRFSIGLAMNCGRRGKVFLLSENLSFKILCSMQGNFHSLLSASVG